MISHGKCTTCGRCHSIHYDCRNPFHNKKQSKYGNHQTTVDGFIFHSKKEAHRYHELLLLQQQGAISDLQLQPLFVLQKGFTYQGKKERPITYSADFKYKENGIEIIEDVKASEYFRTDVYKIKRKLLLYTHPDITFREVY